MTIHFVNGELFKTCSKCKRDLLVDNFYKDKKSKDGRFHKCKDCEKERLKKHYIDNKEKYKESVKRWQINNREKTLALASKAQKMYMERCSDIYIRKIIIQSCGCDIEITQELIEAKRTQLQLFRAVKQLKGAINEQITNSR